MSEELQNCAKAGWLKHATRIKAAKTGRIEDATRIKTEATQALTLVMDSRHLNSNR